MPSSSDATDPVAENSVVALSWTLKDMQGETLDTLDAPVEFLMGGDDLLEAVEKLLIGHTAGDTLHVHLEPDQAFGDYDEEKVFLEKRTCFPAELEEGMAFDGHALPAGCTPGIPANELYIVTDIYPDHVVLDGNHPLAGIGLQLELTVHSVREATEEERERGTAGSSFFRISMADDADEGHHTLH